MTRLFPEPARRVLEALGGLFFLPRPEIGAAVLLLTALAPLAMLYGGLAMLGAEGIYRLARLPKAVRDSAPFRFNPFLFGQGVAATWGAMPSGWGASLPWLTFGAVAASALTMVLAELITTRQGLPLLSLPFAVTLQALLLVARGAAGMTALAGGAEGAGSAGGLAGVMAGYAEGPAAWVVPDLLAAGPWPAAVAGALRALGTVLYLPRVDVGLILLAVLLYHSRALAALAVGGYALAVALCVAVGVPYGIACADPLLFNAPLTAMAVAGAFALPSGRALGIGAVSVTLAVGLRFALGAALAAWALPALVLPFVAATWCGWLLLRASGTLRLGALEASPEEALGRERLWRKQAAPHPYLLSLPFAGEWTVWQGVDGPWTHQGPWRFAFDFVVKDEDGWSYRGDGLAPTDYYCFGNPVLAPCAGRVVAVVDALPDNPVGSPDRRNHWGNLVILRHAEGWYVELSHFMRGSVEVRPGEWVLAGDRLGRCGNSGNSAEPHLHLQVQAQPEIGAASLPFAFREYLRDGRFQWHGVPEEGQRLATPLPEGNGVRALVRPGAAIDLVLQTGGGKEYARRLTVHVGAAGALYWRDETSGGGAIQVTALSRGVALGAVRGEDPALRRLALAFPRLPLCRARRWVDWTDGRPWRGWWMRRWLELVSWVCPETLVAPVYCRAIGGHEWESTVVLNQRIVARTAIRLQAAPIPAAVARPSRSIPTDQNVCSGTAGVGTGSVTSGPARAPSSPSYTAVSEAAMHDREGTGPLIPRAARSQATRSGGTTQRLRGVLGTQEIPSRFHRES